MPTSAKSHIKKCKTKRRTRLKRSEVLKILAAAMENVEGEAGPSTSADPNANNEYSSDFLNTGRVGRRNALPDILSSHATISTADLPDQMSTLTTSDSSKPSSAASSSNLALDAQPTPSTSQISTTSNS